MSGGVRTYCALCPDRAAGGDTLCVECRGLASEVEKRMNDSMLHRWSILIDEIRTEIADLQEQKTVPALMRLRTYMNWSIQAIDAADKELTDGAM